MCTCRAWLHAPRIHRRLSGVTWLPAWRGFGLGLLASVAALSSCGDDDGGRDGIADTATSDHLDDTDVSNGDDGVPDAGMPEDESPLDGLDGALDVPPLGDETDTTSPPSPAATSDADDADADTNPPAQDTARWSLPERYISAVSDTRLVFEIDSVQGMEPRTQSEADLIARFSPLFDKPDGIEMKHDDDIEGRGDGYVWSFAELRELAPALFDDDEPNGSISIHVMFLDGSYESESGGTVLGIAWGNRYIAMFTQVINESCRSVPLLGLDETACQTAEAGVWSHEVGHVIGLVNNGLEMQRDHEDADHPHHDAQQGCLMYWAYDGPGLVDDTFARLAGGEDEVEFCQDSLDDIARVRMLEP